MTLRTFQTANISHLQSSLILLPVQLYEFVVVSVSFRIYVRLTVAVDTPTHRKRRALLHDLHFLNFAVTLLALQSRYVYVLRVIEVGQIGQVMNPYPFNGTIVLDGRVDLLNFGGLFFDHPVAVHTDIGRRNVGRAGTACARVAVVTVYFVVARV